MKVGIFTLVVVFLDLIFDCVILLGFQSRVLGFFPLRVGEKRDEEFGIWVLGFL